MGDLIRDSLDISQQSLRVNTDMLLKQVAKCRQHFEDSTTVVVAFRVGQLSNLRKRMFEKRRARMTASTFPMYVVFRQVTQPGIHTQDRLSMSIFYFLNDFIQLLKKSNKGLSPVLRLLFYSYRDDPYQSIYGELTRY